VEDGVSKIVVQHDTDPCIGIVLEEVPEGTPGRAHGWHGTCTQCGRVMHWWHRDPAIAGSRAHVDRHEVF
jgi:hypothetical protein